MGDRPIFTMNQNDSKNFVQQNFRSGVKNFHFLTFLNIEFSLEVLI